MGRKRPSHQASGNHTSSTFINETGCSSVRSKYRPWKAGAAGSNPAARTNTERDLWRRHHNPGVPSGRSPTVRRLNVVSSPEMYGMERGLTHERSMPRVPDDPQVNRALPRGRRDETGLLLPSLQPSFPVGRVPDQAAGRNTTIATLCTRRAGALLPEVRKLKSTPGGRNYARGAGVCRPDWHGQLNGNKPAFESNG